MPVRDRILQRLRAWYRKRREIVALRDNLEAVEGLLWAVREVPEIRGGAPAGIAIALANDVATARARLEERKRQP